jgi:hypothetical protein
MTLVRVTAHVVATSHECMAPRPHVRSTARSYEQCRAAAGQMGGTERAPVRMHGEMLTGTGHSKAQRAASGQAYQDHPVAEYGAYIRRVAAHAPFRAKPGTGCISRGGLAAPPMKLGLRKGDNAAVHLMPCAAAQAGSLQSGWTRGTGPAPLHKRKLALDCDTSGRLRLVLLLPQAAAARRWLLLLGFVTVGLPATLAPVDRFIWA